jgi:hypothetical protein
MADEAPCTLNCLIEGESLLFRAKPAGNKDVIDLRKLIWEERKNGVLSSVDATDLTLWKVRTMASDSTTNSPAG